MVTAGEDENIKLYNLDPSKKLANIYGIQSICLKLLSTKKYIISAHENGIICFINKENYSIYHR